MRRNPHLLLEGCRDSPLAYAIGAKVPYIYIRGEFFTFSTYWSARSKSVRQRISGEDTSARLRVRVVHP